MSINYERKFSRKYPRTDRHESRLREPIQYLEQLFEIQQHHGKHWGKIQTIRNKEKMLQNSKKRKHKSSRIRMALPVSTFKICISDHIHHIFIQYFQVFVFGVVVVQVIKFVIFLEQLKCKFNNSMDPVFMHAFMFLERCL